MDRFPALERVRHAELHTVFHPEARVLLIPLPGAGSTPLLDLMSRAIGADRGVIDRPDIPSAATALHDAAAWPAENRWSELGEGQRQEITTATDWLRVTVTADPAARLWAAWQHVVLLRHEQADARFAEESWFPDTITDTTDLLAAFRRFVRALGEGDLLFQEPWWTPQSLLLETMPAPTRVFADHQSSEAVALLGERLGVPTVDLVADAPAPIPYHPGVYDAVTASLVNRIHAADRQAWDYPALAEIDVELPPEWRELASSLLPVVRDLAERNVRHEELRRRWLAAEKQVDLERTRNQHLRDRLDERWDERSSDRAAIVALTTRADNAEEDLARAQQLVAELRSRIDQPTGWQRARAGARNVARRTRDRMRNRTEEA